MFLPQLPAEMAEFYPHGYCYLWQRGLVLLHLISDSVITLSYYSIPIGLVWFVRKRKDVPFNWIFWLFAIFIAGCGTTHLMEIWTLWHPSYWVAGGVKALTAAASVGTAIALVPLLPKAVALPTPAALARANQELQTANQELESFSYSVSHDLRAPLRAINGFSRILLDDHQASLDEEGQRLLGIVRDNSLRMGQLIDDLLDFSRLGRTSITGVPVDMEALVRQVVSEVQQTEIGRRLRVEIGDLPTVMGDAALLRQVVFNLVSNAAKFTHHRSDPRLEITSRLEKDQVIFKVSDNGAGFDMRFADKLFGVFQRLHPPEQFEGTGVGLALTKRIIQRHGGSISGEGKVDRGATFTITLPRAFHRG